MMSTVPDLLDSIPRLTPVQQEKLDNLFERFRTQMLQKIIEREKKQAEDVHRMKNIVLL